MKKFRAVVLAGISTVSLTGCASMFGRSSDLVTIRSTDPEATILVNGNAIGTGTAQYKVKRGKDVTLTVSKTGCQERSVQTDTSLVGWTWLNIFFWPGFIVDAATGDMRRTDPTEYTLTPACPVATAPAAK